PCARSCRRTSRWRGSWHRPPILPCCPRRDRRCRPAPDRRVRGVGWASRWRAADPARRRQAWRSPERQSRGPAFLPQVSFPSSFCRASLAGHRPVAIGHCPAIRVYWSQGPKPGEDMPHLKLRDGAELYYEKHGSGPPLFLVPGLGGDGRFWEPHLADLGKHFTVVVHDHRGTARSTLSKIKYSVDQMANDALQLIDALGFARVHWCGHSTGGAMGQVLAITQPDRIDRLVLSATWAKTDAFFRRFFESRGQILRELGPAAYLRASGLALNMPSWVR